jgi:hypothetical protein
MAFPSQATVEVWKQTWTNRLVKVLGDRPELQRFQNRVGRVVTVNYGGKAIVDFGDGGWYDVVDFETALVEVTDEAEKTKYDPTANSAQKQPPRQS